MGSPSIAAQIPFPERLGFESMRVFVVAAHPDDDAIGCGGLMSVVARGGGSVRVAYLTDGSQSHPGSRAYGPASVAAIRESEALAALRVLGVNENPSFYRLPDAGLHEISSSIRTATIARLANELMEFLPHLVLAPWRRDPHCDHIAASSIATDAAAFAGYRGRFAMYEVWLPIHGAVNDAPAQTEAVTLSLTLDAESIETKRHSILAHASQTTNLISDDPSAFRITEPMLDAWVAGTERYHVLS